MKKVLYYWHYGSPLYVLCTSDVLLEGYGINCKTSFKRRQYGSRLMLSMYLWQLKDKDRNIPGGEWKILKTGLACNA